MSKIAITDYFEAPEEEKEILGDLVGMNVNSDTEVLLVWHKKIDYGFIKDLPNLKGVQRYGVGYDNLDLDLLKSKNIIACNVPDYGTDEVSDTTVAMILNIARGVSLYNHNAKKYFNNWQENVDQNIKRNSEIVVGIIGAGRIGGSVILKCNALRFKTIFYDKYKEQGLHKLLNSSRVGSLNELLVQSDIVSLHVPLSGETYQMVDRKFISLMKKGASLINTARGGLFLNLEILFESLKNGQLNQLALDVLPDEPPNSGNLLIDAWRNSVDWLNGRVIINPHTSYYSIQSIKEMRIKASENALRIYRNQKPLNIL